MFVEFEMLPLSTNAEHAAFGRSISCAFPLAFVVSTSEMGQGYETVLAPNPSKILQPSAFR
jgi:hypothetical protein